MYQMPQNRVSQGEAILMRRMLAPNPLARAIDRRGRLSELGFSQDRQGNSGNNAGNGAGNDASAKCIVPRYSRRILVSLGNRGNHKIHFEREAVKPEANDFDILLSVYPLFIPQGRPLS